MVTAGGLAMLGLVKTNTSSAIIVCCNIIIGLGLGFTAIAMTSSVKFLPVNKTGIGSGIVNAARYIGQALGMALLVTILNNSVITAKYNIRTTAYNQINERVLSHHVKKVARKQVKAIFDNDSNNNSHTKQQVMQRKIKQAAKSTNGLPIPKARTSYRKLYLANQKLTTGTQQLENIPQLKTAVAKVNAGQYKIGVGIKLLAQREQLIQALNKIKSAKNYQLAHAFSKVFNITALITLIACPLAYSTDRELNGQQK